MTLPNPDANPTRDAAPIQREGRSISLKATAAITVVITALMTVLSMAFGGFGAQDAQTQGSYQLTLPIVMHLGTALPALFLGPVILLRRKGDRAHKMMGRVWVALMLTTAVSSAFIRSPGSGIAGTGFSFIHIFTIWTLVNAPLGVWMARQGRIRAHRGAMTGLYIGLVIAGAFTFIPGRLLGNLVFA